MLIRNSAPLGPYIRIKPRALFLGGGLFIMSEVLLYKDERVEEVLKVQG